VVAIDNPDLTGDWGGYMDIRVMRGAHLDANIGDVDGVTMSINQAGGMASVRIRQGHFGLICSSLSRVGPCATIRVCSQTREIPIDVPGSTFCNSDNYNNGVSRDVYRGLKVDPYMLDPERDIHMGSDTIHMTFWTHACTVAGGTYSSDQLATRHWALWMDTAGPANTRYLEVRYALHNKAGHDQMYWFVAGSLERC
jgi:hypothetical protein